MIEFVAAEKAVTAPDHFVVETQNANVGGHPIIKER